MSGNGPIEFDEGWEIVKKGLTKLKNILEGIPEQPFTAEDYMMIYATIYSLCTQKPPHDYSQKVYEKYEEEIRDYLSWKAFPSLESRHGDFLLRDLVKRWGNHKVMVRWLSRLFNYVNRYFVGRRGLPNLHEVGFSCKMIVYQQMKGNVREAVIALINRERDCEQTDNTLLKNVVDIFIEIGGESMEFYVNDFEVYFLQDTGVYFARKASSWVWDDSCPLEDIWKGYISKAEECCKREKERILPYVHSSTEPKLLEKIHQEIYVPYKNHLLEKELAQFLSLLTNNMVDEISRIYKNRKVAHFLEPVAKFFKEHAAAEGTSLLKQAEDAIRGQATAATVGQLHQELVTNLIELHDRYMVYVTECFSGHFLFRKALDDAFRTFLDWGLSTISTGELLVNFCDNIFKKGGPGKLNDEAIEETLGKVVELIAYISDRSLFIEFYRRSLARRLLLEQSSVDEHERFMLSKLKHRFGAYFTSKLEGMVVDLELSKEMAMEFKNHLSNHQSADLGLDLSVSVLTAGYWPSIKSTNLNLLDEMEKPLRIFEEFFRSRRQHRRLSWIFSFGNCVLTGRFDTKTIEMVLSTYQAAVLLLFNGVDRLSYGDILAQWKLPEVDLVRVLHSLACGKYKILTKDPGTKTVHPTDVFEFNPSFFDRMTRIKVPLPLVEDRKKVIQDIDRDRRYAIDASLVRIMKTRKFLNHQQLVAECTEQMRHVFKPDLRTIKMRIEDLIYREYLERDKEDKQLVRYVA